MSYFREPQNYAFLLVHADQNIAIKRSIQHFAGPPWTGRTLVRMAIHMVDAAEPVIRRFRV